MQHHTHVLAPAAVEVATSLDVVRAEEPLAAWLATTRITLIHACSDGVRAGAIDPGEAERIVRVSVLILVIGRPDDQDLRVVDLRSRREVRPEQRQQFLAPAGSVRPAISSAIGDIPGSHGSRGQGTRDARRHPAGRPSTEGWIPVTALNGLGRDLTVTVHR